MWKGEVLGFGGFEALAQGGGKLLGKAGAGAAGVDQVTAGFGVFVVVAEEEGADAWTAGIAFAGQGVAADDEFLLVEAFGFEPVAVADTDVFALRLFC